MIQTVKDLVASQADAAVALAKEIWNYAELSYEEVRSAAALIEALKKEIEELKIKDEEQRQELNEKHRQFLSLNTESIELLKNEIRNKWEIWTKQQNA